MLVRMYLRTDFHVADREQAAALLAGRIEGRACAHLIGVDAVKLTRLFRILARYRRPYGAPEGGRLLKSEGSRRWAVWIPPRLVAMLSTAEPLLDAVADEWMRTPEIAAERWSRATVRHALAGLV